MESESFGNSDLVGRIDNTWPVKLGEDEWQLASGLVRARLAAVGWEASGDDEGKYLITDRGVVVVGAGDISRDWGQHPWPWRLYFASGTPTPELQRAETPSPLVERVTVYADERDAVRGVGIELREHPPLWLSSGGMDYVAHNFGHAPPADFAGLIRLRDSS
jgi:hypothetical protein